MKVDRDTALMALSMSETMHLVRAMHMPEDKLKKEIDEILEIAMEEPIDITQPRKWVRLNALHRAAVYRGILKKDAPPTCRQQVQWQESLDKQRKGVGEKP